MKLKNISKKLLVCTAAAAMALSMATAVSAMPSDLEEAGEDLADYYDNYHEDDYDPNTDYDGDGLVDDEDYLSSIGAYYVATLNANVRSYPNGPIIGTLTQGQKYYVVAQRDDCNWYQISGYSTNAYVWADYLVPQSEYSGSTSSSSSGSTSSDIDVEVIDIEMQATADVNMREVPGGNIVGVLAKGSDIHVTGNVDNRSWYRCEYNNETVYICDDYLTPDFPQTMKATYVVNVRTGPSTSSSIQGVLNIGDKVKVSSEESGGWYKFTYEATGQIGYSYKDYLAACAD